MDQPGSTGEAQEGAREPSLEELQARIESIRALRRIAASVGGAAPAPAVPARPPVVEVVPPMPAPQFHAALASTLGRSKELLEQINARGAAHAAQTTAAGPSRRVLSPEEVQRREAARRERRIDIARAIGIPEDGADGVFATAIDHRAPPTRIMRAFVERLDYHRTTRNAVLYVASSAPGLGKTAGMCWAALNQRPPAIQAFFVKASDAASSVAWGETAETYRRMRAVPLLLLDEAGGEYDPTRITELIEYRWDYGLVTFVTTNLKREPWWARYGSSRMASRIGPHAPMSKIAEFAQLPDLRDKRARDELRKAGAQ